MEKSREPLPPKPDPQSEALAQILITQRAVYQRRLNEEQLPKVIKDALLQTIEDIDAQLGYFISGSS